MFLLKKKSLLLRLLLQKLQPGLQAVAVTQLLVLQLYQPTVMLWPLYL